MEEQPFSDDPLLHPLEDIIRSMDVAPGGSEQYTPRDPEVQAGIDNVEAAMAYIASIQGRTFGALFGSVTEGRSGSLPPDAQGGLAGYDSSSPAQSLAFEVAISTEYLKPALREAGLGVDRDGRPCIYVADGDRFVGFMHGLQPATEKMKAGIADMVGHVFSTVMMAHVPGWDDERYETFHQQPMLLPEVGAGVDMTRAYGVQTDQTILHAPEIAEAMRTLGVDDRDAANLTMLHEAAREGKLGEWSVAYAWGLQNKPTTNLSTEWEQWLLPHEWQKLFEFMDGAQARNPEGSAFLRKLTDLFISNITDMRNGNVVRVEPRTSPGFEDEKDELHFTVPDDYAEDTESATYLGNEHDALLADVVARLKLYSF